VKRPSYLLRAFSPLPSFRHELVSFDLTFMQICERLLGPSCFECLKPPLVHWEVMFPISRGSIGFILAKTIELMIFLGSWALVTLVITSRFLLDLHPFLLEAIGVSSSSSLPFQMHMRLSWKYFPPIAITCLSMLEQLVKRGAN